MFLPWCRHSRGNLVGGGSVHSLGEVAMVISRIDFHISLPLGLPSNYCDNESSRIVVISPTIGGRVRSAAFVSSLDAIE
ncbi:hypothetical protein Tco_1122902 [Tanacetum coccineum]|uniref:Uncharacterized protein n=1 Tax=Tanacetum coccineum TaxID=301880 RepID=A0ABQ5J1U6_9ASTR